MEGRGHAVVLGKVSTEVLDAAQPFPDERTLDLRPEGHGRWQGCRCRRRSVAASIPAMHHHVRRVVLMLFRALRSSPRAGSPPSLAKYSQYTEDAINFRESLLIDLARCVHVSAVCEWYTPLMALCWGWATNADGIRAELQPHRSKAWCLMVPRVKPHAGIRWHISQLVNPARARQAPKHTAAQGRCSDAVGARCSGVGAGGPRGRPLRATHRRLDAGRPLPRCASRPHDACARRSEHVPAGIPARWVHRTNHQALDVGHSQ